MRKEVTRDRGEPPLEAECEDKSSKTNERERETESAEKPRGDTSRWCDEHAFNL